jgi:uncharacterized protein (PEP-CTERM system associated)
MAAAQRASAAEVKLTPRAMVEETYTDNARGSAEDRRSDFVTTLGAGLEAGVDGRRLRLAASYDAYFDLYARESDLDGFRQRGLGVAGAELVEDTFYLDTRAALSQQSVNRFGGVTATERTVGRDQTQILNLSLSPRLVTRLGGWTVNELIYRLTAVRFFAADVGDAGAAATPEDSLGHRIEGAVRSGPEFSALAWTLAASRHTNRAGEGAHLDRTTVGASGEYQVHPQAGLLAGAGYDWIDRLDSAGEAERLSGPFWNLGLHLVPGRRSELRLSGGRRYDGWDLAGQLRAEIMPGLALRGATAVDVQTQQTAFTRALDSVAVGADGTLVDSRTGLAVDPNQLGTVLVRRTFRTRTAQVGLVAEGERDHLVLAYQRIERSFTGGNAGHDSTDLVSARFSHDLSPRTTVSLQGSVARLGGTEGRATTVLTSVGVSHALSDKATTDVRYSHLSRDAAEETSENALSARLTVSY